VPPAVRPASNRRPGNWGEKRRGFGMIHKAVPVSAVFIYAAKSLGLFALLIAGIYAVLMLERTIGKWKK